MLISGCKFFKLQDPGLIYLLASLETAEASSPSISGEESQLLCDWGQCNTKSFFDRQDLLALR